MPEAPGADDRSVPDVAQRVREVSEAALGGDVAMEGSNFFELGGDSLAAATVADGLSQAVGVEVPVDLVFDASDLKNLAEQLEERLAQSGSPDRNLGT
ncbi:MAG: acyl carrier protein [Actinocatenispora sp.]